MKQVGSALHIASFSASTVAHPDPAAPRLCAAVVVASLGAQELSLHLQMEVSGGVTIGLGGPDERSLTPHIGAQCCTIGLAHGSRSTADECEEDDDDELHGVHVW